MFQWSKSAGNLTFCRHCLNFWDTRIHFSIIFQWFFNTSFQSAPIFRQWFDQCCDAGNMTFCRPFMKLWDVGTNFFSDFFVIVKQLVCLIPLTSDLQLLKPNDIDWKFARLPITICACLKLCRSLTRNSLSANLMFSNASNG